MNVFIETLSKNVSKVFLLKKCRSIFKTKNSDSTYCKLCLSKSTGPLCLLNLSSIFATTEALCDDQKTAYIEAAAAAWRYVT